MLNYMPVGRVIGKHLFTLDLVHKCIAQNHLEFGFKGALDYVWFFFGGGVEGRGSFSFIDW